MQVKDVKQKLEEFNQDANIRIIVNNKPFDFSFAYGSSEGVTKKTCETVSLYIDGICYEEHI